MHEETGKPLDDAKLEIILAVLHIDWAARHARRVLRPRRVRSGLLALNQVSTLEYLPLGVIGVIGPWNYPMFTPMGSIAYALAAGNAVVFKPSELTPLIGARLGEIAARTIGIPNVLQVVTGAGATGAALARAAVDKIAFTGSTATGKKVMMAAAERLTPVLIELGGKDPMIVAEDADVDKAAEAAVFGALTNAGQACMSVERVYVADAVYDSFVERLTKRVNGLRPVTTRRPHRADDPAVADGGGRQAPRGRAGPRRSRGGRRGRCGSRPYIQPVVLTDVPEGSTAMTEETFGPR